MNKIDKQFEASGTKIARSSLTPVKTERFKQKPKPKPNALNKRQPGVKQTKRCSFEITDDLERRLAEQAKASGVKKSQLIRNALEAYLT